MKNQLSELALESILEIVKTKKRCEVSSQKIDQARKYYEKAVGTQDDLKGLIKSVYSNEGISEEDKKEIALCLFRLHKDVLAFDKECIRIIESRK